MKKRLLSFITVSFILLGAFGVGGSASASELPSVYSKELPSVYSEELPSVYSSELPSVY
jgi:hypothetical protein